MSEAHKAICPNCRGPLQKVRQGSDSMLNAEQFDAVRAGDWFCSSCPEAGKRYRYFWDRDLQAKPEAHKEAVKNDERGALPCPFCGSANISEGEVLTANPDGGTSTQSMCRECGALGPDAHLRDGEVDFGSVKATAAWKSRAASPQAPADDGAEATSNPRRAASEGPEFEDGPDEDGFKGPRPYNGFQDTEDTRTHGDLLAGDIWPRTK